MPLSVFWFRRDLRLYDNVGLYEALNSGDPVLPIFIFDSNILDVNHPSKLGEWLPGKTLKLVYRGSRGAGSIRRARTAIGRYRADSLRGLKTSLRD